jgi:hypothetical protein
MAAGGGRCKRPPGLSRNGAHLREPRFRTRSTSIPFKWGRLPITSRAVLYEPRPVVKWRLLKKWRTARIGAMMRQDVEACISDILDCGQQIALQCFYC